MVASAGTIGSTLRAGAGVAVGTTGGGGTVAAGESSGANLRDGAADVGALSVVAVSVLSVTMLVSSEIQQGSWCRASGYSLY